MNSDAGGALTLVIGAVLLRLSITGAHRRYVRAGMGPWLIVAGVVLVVLGASALVRSWRRGVSDRHDDDGADHDHDHGTNHGEHEHGGHEHGHGGERVAWLLAAPVVTLLLIAPPALGAFALDRSASRVTTTGRGNWPPLLAGATPTRMPLADFYQRAYDAGATSFGGARVELTGFVAKTSGDGFLIARYQIACCAADAVASVARIVGYVGAAPRRDQWVTVVGTFQSVGDDGPRLVAESVTPVAPPNDPYD